MMLTDSYSDAMRSSGNGSQLDAQVIESITLAGLLDETALQHLLPKLQHLDQAAIEGMVLADKAENMAALKALGIDKLPERQKLSNTLSKKKRAVEGFGMPVLVCFYGSGLSHEVGVASCETITALARGGCLHLHGPKLTGKWSTFPFDSVITLPHFDQPPFREKGLRSWDEYISEVIAQIDGHAARRGRPLLIAAHSYGAAEAYHLAARLGRRVRHVTIIASRVPSEGHLDETQLIPDDDSDGALLKWAVSQWGLASLQKFVGVPEEQWTSSAREAVATLRQQFFSQIPLSRRPPEKKVLAPVLGIVSAQEPAHGETAERMQGWAEVTTGGFELVTVPESHLGALSSNRLPALLVAAWEPILRRGGKEDNIFWETGSR